jgi:hypothetical protein
MANKSASKLTVGPKKTKGTGSMTIEAASPKAKPVVDLTKPRSESITPPKKPGLNLPSIGALDKAGPGWKAQNDPAHLEDTPRPGYTGVVKT